MCVYITQQKTPPAAFDDAITHISVYSCRFCAERENVSDTSILYQVTKNRADTQKNSAEKHRGNVIVEASLEIKRDIVAGFHRNNICKNSALAGIIIYLRPRSICCFHKAQTRQS